MDYGAAVGSVLPLPSCQHLVSAVAYVYADAA